MTIDLTGRVAIVTGAGGGLGRTHALLLAGRGAKVVVNDLGTTSSGAGSSSTAAQQVVDEICALGGEAIADGGSVTDYAAVQSMVAKAMEKWGRIDILVNNAGFLRDKSFTKMEIEDFRQIIDVHLMGAVHTTKAVWDIMREQHYGRIVMTTSSSGLFGNFGQSNYGAAKMALVGMMQTLGIEGEKSNIRVNSLAPSAGTRMLEGLLPPKVMELLEPEAVSPAILALVAENAPTRAIICAGAGSFEQAMIGMTEGIFIGRKDDAAEEILARWDELSDTSGICWARMGGEQGALELKKAGFDMTAAMKA